MIDFFPSISNILSELITGAVGGIVVATFTFGSRVYGRKKIESKFPLGGEYISFFEDIVNGEVVVVPSLASVKQRGSSVKLTNTMEGGRSWSLEGTLLPGGHISGVYSADAAYDDGVGSFYLKVGPHELDGMWNGYDHDNKQTTSGRYWFRRLFDCQIAKYDRSYLNDILHTSTNAFGSGYVDHNSILKNDRSYAIVALVDGEFAGYCFGYIEEPKSINALIGQDLPVLPDDVRMADEEGVLGVLKTVAVRGKFRGHGVGHQLVAAAEKELKDLKAECIVVPAWTIGEKTSMRNMLVSNDYTEWVNTPDFWQKNCEQRKFECTSFKQDRCQCSVSYFRKGRF